MKELFPLNIENDIDTLEYKAMYRSEIENRISKLNKEEIVLENEVNILKSKMRKVVAC